MSKPVDVLSSAIALAQYEKLRSLSAGVFEEMLSQSLKKIEFKFDKAEDVISSKYKSNKKITKLKASLSDLKHDIKSLAEEFSKESKKNIEDYISILNKHYKQLEQLQLSLKNNSDGDDFQLTSSEINKLSKSMNNAVYTRLNEYRAYVDKYKRKTQDLYQRLEELLS